MNINRVCVVGNLTRDVELRATGSGTQIGSLRIAVNTRIKRDGEWSDKANYFDVTVFGNQADACAKFLHKGSQVGVDGRLDWREWEQDGNKRQAVQIVADTVQFLGGRDDAPAPASDVPSDFEAQPSSLTPGSPGTQAPDDDIPFRWEGTRDYIERREHANR